MVVKQARFEFCAIRRQCDRIAGGRKRKGFEITADEQIDGIGGRNVNGGIAQNGIGKRKCRPVGSNHSTAVTNLEVDRLIPLNGKHLHGGSEFIQFPHLNGSIDQNLHALFRQGIFGEAADHRLMVFDQFFASGIELRFVNAIKMLRKILRGEFRNRGRADVGKHGCFRAVTQSHGANIALRIRRAGILKAAQIISGWIFAILRDFPISIHVVYLYPKQKNSLYFIIIAQVKQKIKILASVIV